MKSRYHNFDNIFNCPDCNKTLWRVKTLSDGKKVFPTCYEKYLKIENDEKTRKKAYIDLTSRDLIDKGLSDLIFNFFEKRYIKNPNEDEVKKLWNLFKLKYNLEIEYDSFFEIIKIVYQKIHEKIELDSFEKEITPEKLKFENNIYFCAVCNSQIDKQTYEYSINNYNKALCSNHHGTKHHRNLFFCIKKTRDSL